MKKIVNFNVGGKIFSTSKDNLFKFKDSYFEGLAIFGQEENGAYFIDRNPKLFSIILDYLRTGEINLIREHINSCSEYFKQKIREELQYFKLPLPPSLIVYVHPPKIEEEEEEEEGGLGLSLFD